MEMTNRHAMIVNHARHDGGMSFNLDCVSDIHCVFHCVNCSRLRVNCQQKSLRQAQPLDDAQPDGLAHQVGLAELNPLRLGDLTIAELAEHLGVLRLVDHGNTITQNEIMSTP